MAKRKKLTREERAKRNAAKQSRQAHDNAALRARFAREAEDREREKIEERARKSGVEIAKPSDIQKLAGTNDNMKGPKT